MAGRDRCRQPELPRQERSTRRQRVQRARGCRSRPSRSGQVDADPAPWRLAPFARKDQASWEAFLGALDGAPKVIVTDADHALALAIKSVFGETVEHRLCEWHLGRNLRQHLPDEILADRWHPITKALPDAFHSLKGWERLEQAIEAERTLGLHRPLALAVGCQSRLVVACSVADRWAASRVS
jgi:hypothetical protein